MEPWKQVFIRTADRVSNDTKCWNKTRMAVSLCQLLVRGLQAATVIISSRWEILNNHTITDTEKGKLYWQLGFYIVIWVCWAIAVWLSYPVFYGVKKYQSCIDDLKGVRPKTAAVEVLTVSALQSKMNSPEHARDKIPRRLSPSHSVVEEPLSTDRQRLTLTVGSVTGKRTTKNVNKVTPDPTIPMFAL
jgi:hypothetical protein